MKKYTLLFTMVIFLVVFIGVFTLFKRNDETKNLEALIEVETFEKNENQDEMILEAQISMPDYSRIFFECYEKAEKKAKSEKDFEKTLYTMAMKIAKKTEERVSQTVHIELKEEDKNLSEKELEKIVTQAVFEKELEEFCLAILTEAIP